MHDAPNSSPFHSQCHRYLCARYKSILGAHVEILVYSHIPIYLGVLYIPAVTATHTEIDSDSATCTTIS